MSCSSQPKTYDLRTGQIDLAIDFEGIRFREALLDGSTRLGPETLPPIALPLSFGTPGRTS